MDREKLARITGPELARALRKVEPRLRGWQEMEAHASAALVAARQARGIAPIPPRPPVRRHSDPDRREAELYATRLGMRERLRGGGGGSGGAGPWRELVERLAEARSRYRSRFLGGAGRAVLIGCSATKGERGTPEQFYRGALFRSAHAYAVRRGLPWFVLSARHHFVLPTQQLSHYETKLTAGRVSGWTDTVIHMMGGQYGLLTAGTPVQPPVWEIHAGSLYADELATALEARGEVVTRPLQGLQIGERKRWYRLAEEAQP